MAMELRHLRYFLAVAQELNFRRAAEVLGMHSHRSVAKSVDLENELGVKLFRRVPKGAELTEAGVAFLSAVPVVFEKIEHAVKTARKGNRGEIGQLRVGYTGSAAFKPSRAAFCAGFPSRLFSGRGHTAGTQYTAPT